MNIILKYKINQLARVFYMLLGYTVEDGYDFSKAKHPMELRMFDMAKASFDFWEQK